MGIDLDQLHPLPTPPKGLPEDAVQPVGTIMLPVFAGIGHCTITTITNFLVVKAHSFYDVILGRPTLNSLKAKTCTYHLKMKFSTDAGVGEVGGEQVLARMLCTRAQKWRRDIWTTKSSKSGAALLSSPPELIDHKVKTRDELNLKEAEANEPLELVALEPNHLEATTRIGTRMGSKTRQQLKQVMIKHKDVFAWSHGDICLGSITRSSSIVSA